MAGWKWQRSSRLLKHEATLRITSTKTVSSNILSKQLPVERGTVGVVFYPKTQQHNGLSQGSNPCAFFNARLTVSTLNPSWNENQSGFKVGLSASFWKMPFNAFCVTNFPLKEAFLRYKLSSWPFLHNFNNDAEWQRKINSLNSCFAPYSTAFSSNQDWQKLNFNCSPGIRNLITIWIYFIVSWIPPLNDHFSSQWVSKVIECKLTGKHWKEFITVRGSLFV